MQQQDPDRREPVAPPDPLPLKGQWTRVRRERLRGLEAASVGFTWTGYVVVGAVVGWWLDNRFHTGYFLPVLVLVGAGAGFRDLLVFAKRSTERQAELRRQQSGSQGEGQRGLVAADVPGWHTNLAAESETPESSAADEAEGSASISGYKIPPPPELKSGRKMPGDKTRQ